LREAVVAAQVPRPYVLVAHSLGARYALLFAHRHPDEVVGLVLVDAYLQGFDTALGEQKLKTFMANRARQYRVLGLLARLGVIRVLGSRMVSMLGQDFRAMPVQERRRYAILATRPSAMETTINEYEEAVASRIAPQPVSLKENLPMRVLAHGVPWPYPDYERCWQDSQREAVTWSKRSSLLEAEKSGHGIMFSQPELIVEAARKIVEEGRPASG
jgi:pimeloyl-ACP methyl ester carboxylesterase